MGRGSGEDSTNGVLTALRGSYRGRPTTAVVKNAVATQLTTLPEAPAGDRQKLQDDFYKLSFRSTTRQQQLYNVTDDPENWLMSSGEPLSRPYVLKEILESFKHDKTGVYSHVHEQDPNSWAIEGNRRRGERNPHFAFGDLSGRVSFYRGKGTSKEFVGAAHISIERDANGEMEARVGDLGFRVKPFPENGNRRPEEGEDTEKWLGQGIGRAYHEHLERELAKAGATRMTLHAVGTGAYAWAALGYDFDPRQMPDEVSPEVAREKIARQKLVRARELAENQGFPLEQIEELEAAERVTAYDIAKLYKDQESKDHQGHRTWLGMQALGDWHGVKWL